MATTSAKEAETSMMFDQDHVSRGRSICASSAGGIYPSTGSQQVT
jgi:hypothetical protein